jgi:tetratricopeptide (TPR) repeat protein
MTTTGGDAWERTRALIGLGRYDEAAAAARSGLTSTPDDPDLALLYASALCETRDPDALAAARHAVALQPDRAATHRVLGWAIYRTGRYAQAADVLAHAISLDPRGAETHVMRAEALLKMAPGSRMQRRMRDALTDEAHAHAAEAVRLRPSTAGGYLVHAKACLAQGDPAGARGWAERALSVEPDHPVGHQVLGLAAQLRGDTAAAADHFVDAGKLDPRSNTPITLLRGLRTSLPVGVVTIFVAIRVAGAVGGALGGAAVAVAMVVTVVPAVLAYRTYGGRWRARRQMSDEARRALARDRRLSPRRLGR